MRVVTLCGSHHSKSTNAALLSVAAERLAGHGVEVEAIGLRLDVPDFRPEQVDDPPDPVPALRAAFDTADGAILAIPEYAGGAPGWVKNITDWMVGSASLYQRPVVVLSAATAGGSLAIEQMARTLTWQGAFVVDTQSVPAPLTKVDDDRAVTDPDTLRSIERTVDALVDAMRAGLARAEELAATALAPLGIDPMSRLS